MSTPARGSERGSHTEPARSIRPFDATRSNAVGDQFIREKAGPAG